MAEGLSDADIGLSDSDIGLTEPQPSQQAPTQASGLSDADIGLSDADIGLPANKPAPEGMVATGAREAAHAALPAAGGLVSMGAGAEAGAAVGAVGGPVGAIGGGILGGLGGLILGSMATNKVQEAGLNAIGFDDSEQRAANIEANPKSAFVGGMAPALASMNPAAAGVKVGERVLGAAGMGGFEAGQEYLNEGKIDPFNVAASAAAGAVAPRLNATGEKVAAAGGRIGKATVAGRPNAIPEPAAVPAQDEAAASQQATVTGDTSLQQPAPTADGSTSGNPQSAPSRSARTYPKGQSPETVGPDMLTQGAFPPDVADALSASLDRSAVVDHSDLPPIPDPMNGVDHQNMLMKGEQLPRETGIEQAGAQSGNNAVPENSVTAAANPAPAPTPAAPAEENNPAPIVGQFKTAMGSQYDLHPDNTTTRNKAARDIPGHEGDEGPKPRSAKTYFVTKDAARALMPPDSDTRFRVIDHGDGTLSLGTRTPDNKGWGISPTQRNVPIASMEPKEGLHPVEVWSPAKLKGMDSYGAMHLGNEITQLGQNGPKAARPVVSDEALLDISRVQREAAARNKTGGDDQEPPTPTLDTNRSAAPQKGLSDEDIGLPPEKLSSAVHAERDNVHPNPSPAQAEAGNFAKGHPGKLYGRGFSIETAKGGVRRDLKNTPPKWEVPNYPTDYGELLGTKGADGDRLDAHYVGTGDKHYVIDQRNPEGAFDEHKIMAYAKDQADALDHYKRGFNDDKDRVGAITEVSADDMKKWVNTPGAKKKPYAEAFSSGPTEGVKPLPKVVTAAVNALKEKGLAEAAAKLEAMEPSARIAAASKYVNKTDTQLARPDRVRTPAPKVEGLDVTGRSKADVARKAADVKTMNDAYDAYHDSAFKRDEFERELGVTEDKEGQKLWDAAKGDPAAEQKVLKDHGFVADEIPKSPEAKAAMRARLQAFLDATKGVKYKPAVKPESYLFQRAVKKLLIAKNPTDKSWTEFAATAKSLKEGGADEVRAMDRTESDIGMSKRSGDEAVTNAENKVAGNNDVEDAMIANIDAKRARAPFELDAEHEETAASPEPVTSAADVKKFAAKTDKLDLTKKADRVKLSEESRKLTENLIKQADRKAAEKPSEEKPGSKGRKIDVGGVDKDALLKSLEKASKKNSTNPHAIREEELGKAVPGLPVDKIAALWNNESGAGNISKIRADWNAVVGPRVRGWLHSVFGLRSGDLHITADALLRQGVTTREKLLAEVADKVDGHMKFYDKLTDRQQSHVQESIENQKGTTFDRAKLEADLQSGGSNALTREQAQIAADHYDVHKALYDWLWQQDKLHGSEEGYVENYVPHIFEEAKVNGQGPAAWINAHNKRLGATWYQKNRLFDTIKAAQAAGFKLKYTNPVEALNARMNASLTGHMMVDIAHSLQKSGLAEKKVDATDFQKRFYTFERTLPDNNTWMFHPDVETLWKNGVEDKGLQGSQGIAGSIYRGWMKWKRTAVPIQLSMSLFHEAHILSISAANELSRAAMNLGKGDSAAKAYGDALKNIKQDLWDMPRSLFRGGTEHPGKTLQKNWGKDSSQLSQDADIWNKLLTEAGSPPKQATEDIIGAKRDFQRAVRNFKMSDGKMLPGMKLALPAVRRGVELSTQWMFQHQIPQLKAAALKRSIADELRHDPGLIDDAVRRKVVLQKLAKNVDDRFGEKFYKGWFINKGLKDAMLGSFVSTGWQAGQLRQAGGAAVDAAKMAGRWVEGDHRSPLEKAADDGADRISFVAHYVGGTMLAAGALSWALSGKVPTGIDYLYPRTGYDNDDGTPNRVSTPFNTREGLQLKAHMDAHNSVMGGLGEYIWNKTILQPIADLMSNRNFYGERMWDPDTHPVKQVLQAGDATLGTMLNPISAAGASKAYQTQGARGAALALTGFGPAPKYVEKDPMQRRIASRYGSDAVASQRPYEYGPKTGLGHGGVQDLIRGAAGDKTEAEARVEGRQKLQAAAKAGDDTGRGAAARELVEQGHVAPNTVKSMLKGEADTFQFSRLPATDQIRLAQDMTPEQFERYVSKNPNSGITKVAKQVMLTQFQKRTLNQ